MRKDWWCEIDLSDKYTIVIHEPGTALHSDELRNHIVIRVVNIEENDVWLIPISLNEAQRIGKILSSLSFLQANGSDNECQK